jgi:hypothetical protein
VQITAALAHYLKILAADPDVGDRLAADLNQLAGEVTVAVPSCPLVSIGLAPAGEILSAPWREATRPGIASLAIRCPPTEQHPFHASRRACARPRTGDDRPADPAQATADQVDKHRSAPAMLATALTLHPESARSPSNQLTQGSRT